MDAVVVENVRKSYGKVEAVRGISFSAAKGELFGLIGPDGAGKTTLMRAMCTLIEPDEGRIVMDGMDASADFMKVRADLGYMPQRFSLYQDLSVEQNMKFFADLFGVPAGERERHLKELFRFSRMEPFRKRRASQLSGGMKQKLALSCSLIHRPSILVLDEPTYGVDPISRKEFWDLLRSIGAGGTTIIVSTAYMDEADLCDRVALMHEGRIMAMGAPGDLKKAFRYPLYRITGPDPRGLREFFRGLPGIHATQLFGDSIHASFEEDPQESSWARWRDLAGGRFDPPERQDPSIEDVFLDLIRKET
jgi:ABC-2 type transport system ATP-binding protein